MKEKNEKMHFPKVTQDNYFMTQEERDEEKLEKIQIIEISKISNFPNHPYRVKDDDEMQDLSDNIKEYGLIYPLLVRPKEDGTYELVSGHRRKRACELAGIKEVKAIVREMTDEEATIQMVDSNLQREEILPSERAFAYRMKLEAIKRQGERNDLTSTQVVQKLSIEIIAEQMGESREKIRRYVRLTYLIPEILQLVDNQFLKEKSLLQMAITPAVEISYLTEEEQEILFVAMESSIATPSISQAQKLRKESENGTLTEEKLYEIFDEQKPNQKDQVKFKYEHVKKYFPKGYTVEQMQNIIEKLLQKYQLQWQKENKMKNYDR